MDPQGFDRFTRELTAWASACPSVVGLIAAGSTAGGRRSPDEWSDHDLVVVTRDGAAAAVRADPSWVPDTGRVVLRFTEPDHGLNVLYDDGHLIELAVCDLSDLGWLRGTDLSALYDVAGLESRLQAVAAETRGAAVTDTDGALRYHRLVKELVIGACRLGRGELLSANQRIRGHALDLYLDLVCAFVPAPEPKSLEPLDPTRRFAQAHPAIAARLAGPLERSIAELLDVLVDLIEETLVGRIAVATPATVALVAQRADDLPARSPARRPKTEPAMRPVPPGQLP